MGSCALVAVLPLLLATAADPGWSEVASKEGVTVFARARADSDVAEVKAQGVIAAPPRAVWSVIRDYARYKDTMPYTRESQVLSREEGGKVVHFYSVVSAPLVSRRDYVIRCVDESDWQDGKGYLKVSWTAMEGGPAPAQGVVRVTLNDGFWLLEPREDGAQTHATYYLHTDPGGALPRWIVDRANRTAVPDVFRTIRRLALAQR